MSGIGPEPDHHGADQQHAVVHPGQRKRGKRRDRGGGAEDEQDVEHVGTYDVADGNGRTAFIGSHHTRSKFGQALSDVAILAAGH